MNAKGAKNTRKARRKTSSFFRAFRFFRHPFAFKYWLRVMVACCCGLGLALAPPQPRAQACSPGPGYPYYTLEQRAHAAEMILEGTVLSTTSRYNMQLATVSVQKYFKNQRNFQPLPPIVTISNLGDNALCLSWVEPGEHWIFFVRGNPNLGLKAFYLEPYAATAPATPETIAEIIEALRYHVYLPLIK